VLFHTIFFKYTEFEVVRFWRIDLCTSVEVWGKHLLSWARQTQLSATSGQAVIYTPEIR